jgi:hypothetical protein
MVTGWAFLFSAVANSLAGFVCPNDCVFRTKNCGERAGQSLGLTNPGSVRQCANAEKQNPACLGQTNATVAQYDHKRAFYLSGNPLMNDAQLSQTAGRAKRDNPAFR